MSDGRGRGGRFPITVLGELAIDHPGVSVSGALSQGKQRVVSVLVAGGPPGVTAGDFAELGADHASASPAALRVAIARVRNHLPAAALPSAVAGRYWLNLPPGDVDVWRLAELTKGPLDTTSIDELYHLLQPTEAYPGIDGIDLVERSRREIQSNQRELLTRLGRESHHLLAGPFQPLLDAHLELNPSNEMLVWLTARSYFQSGDRRRALDVISQARRQFGEAGLDLNGALVELEHQILNGADPIALGRSGGGRPRPTVPRPLAALLIDERVGPDDDLDRVEQLLDESLGTTTLLLGGEPGIGKSRFCAELASRAVERRIPVLYLVQASADGGAFAPLMAALPEFRTRASEILSQRLEPSLRKAGLWSAAHEAISAEAGGGPILIIVDDAQEHDSQTAELIGHLAGSTSNEPMLLVVAGRTGTRDDEETWHTLSTTLRRSAGVVEIPLRPLDGESMVELVRSRRPDLGVPLAHQVASELLLASRGLPGVAALALANLDDDDLAPRMSSLSSDRLLRSVVDRLSTGASRVGAVASLIGPQFTVGAVEHISGLSEIEVLDAIDELVRRQLVIERSVVDFTIAHLLVSATLLDRALQANRSRWHLAAADYFAADPHRRADHLAQAVPRVSAAAAVEALLESAAIRLDEGLYWEAVRSYRRARVLRGRELEPVDGGRLARALDLSGVFGQGERVRAEAFAVALERDAPSLALEIATSSLPEGESFGGDRRIVDRLQTIEPASLDRAHRLDLVCHLSRQLAILGELPSAVEQADGALHLARLPSERVRAALTKRFAVTMTVPPDERIRLLATVAEDAATLDSGERADLAMLRALDLYEAGQPVEARSARAELDALPDPLPPVRRWHAQLFDAMMAVDQGDLTAAAAARSDALGLARRLGVQEAEKAHQAAGSLVAWLTMTPPVGGSRPEPGGRVIDDRSPMAEAGRARTLAAAGRRAEAVELAGRTAREVLASPLSDGIVTLALLATLLPGTGDRELVDETRSLLEIHRGAMLIVGAFVASIGPVPRYLAALARDRSERVKLLSAALGQAEAAGSTLWLARAHRDLARATGRPGHSRKLASLVADTELVGLALR